MKKLILAFASMFLFSNCVSTYLLSELQVQSEQPIYSTNDDNIKIEVSPAFGDKLETGNISNVPLKVTVTNSSSEPVFLPDDGAVLTLVETKSATSINKDQYAKLVDAYTTTDPSRAHYILNMQCSGNYDCIRQKLLESPSRLRWLSVKDARFNSEPIMPGTIKSGIVVFELPLGTGIFTLKKEESIPASYFKATIMFNLKSAMGSYRVSADLKPIYVERELYWKERANENNGK